MKYMVVTPPVSVIAATAAGLQACSMREAGYASDVVVLLLSAVQCCI